ncbi:MAG: ROK family protein [Planctomycetes bacterium]|nr:ROK family protein [Planctomycetota bacterium]
MGAVIGIDVGGTNMQIGVVDETNALVGRAARRTQASRGLDHVLGVVADGVDEACRAAGIAGGDVAAVGVAAAGAIDVPRGVVLDSTNMGWQDVPLRDLLAERLGRPVVLDNDVNGAVWSEHQLGAAGGRGDLLGIWVGTGIGGGLVLNGQVYHGDRFTAGEVGHTVLRPDGEQGMRTVEDLCSRTGLRRQFGRLLPDHPGSALYAACDGDAERLGTTSLARAYADGDALAVRVIDGSADYLGVAIANWVTVLALPAVIVGGGITEALGAPYLDRIRASFVEHVFPDEHRSCALSITELAADAGLLGAALLARERVQREV